MAGLDQPFDQVAHFVDMPRRARLDCRRQAAERGDVFVKLPVGQFGDLADRFVERQVWIFLRRPRIDLVVDVGDVGKVSIAPVLLPSTPLVPAGPSGGHFETDKKDLIYLLNKIQNRVSHCRIFSALLFGMPGPPES